MATTRPARSASHLPKEEAARVEADVRVYFNSVPRRPAKPPRSDPSEDGGAEAGVGDHDLPELRKLHDLEDRERTPDNRGKKMCHGKKNTHRSSDWELEERAHI